MNRDTPESLNKQMNKWLDQVLGKQDGLVKVAYPNAANTNDSYKRYRSSFLTMGDFQIPDDFREIFKWCRYFFKFDPLIGPVVRKLATFPITDYILNDSEAAEEDDNIPNDENSPEFEFYENLLKTINYPRLLVEIGLDYYLYGNCIIFAEPGIKEFKRRNPDTGQIETRKEMTWKSIRRLDPSCVRITRNPQTQEKIFHYEVPEHIVQVIKRKAPKKEYEQIPQIFKDAVRKKGIIRLNSKYVYDFSMPSESGDNDLWATPPMVHAMKLIMYTNVLRQAQEAIAYEHIIPKRIYFFEPSTSGAYNSDFNFGRIADDFSFELKKQINDPNYQIVSPLPVQQVMHGGQGRNLLLVPEIEQNNKQILAALNVPQEFIFGGVSYSGSTTSLRILENDFITYRNALLDFSNNFLIKRIAEARGEWETEDDNDKLMTISFADLKMQDDAQQKELMIRLNEAGKLPDEIFYEKVLGLDASKVKKQLEVEQKERMIQQMNLQMEQMKLQQQMQQEMMNLGIQPPVVEEPNEENVDEEMSDEESMPVAEDSQPMPLEQAQVEEQMSLEDMQRMAFELSKLSENEALSAIAKLPATIQQYVQHFYRLIMDEKEMETDMRPYPTQLPPRREGGV